MAPDSQMIWSDCYATVALVAALDTSRIATAKRATMPVHFGGHDGVR